MEEVDANMVHTEPSGEERSLELCSLPPAATGA